MTVIQVDSEFQTLIPPPSTEELQLLAANLKEFGCLQPLVVWKDRNILLDGHNRRNLCHQLSIPYTTVEIELTDRRAAIAWIANHQLGRRNITSETASYLRGKRYSLLKGNPRDNLRQNLLKGHFVTSVDVAQELAQQYKVSSRTIKRDVQFSESIDALALALGAGIKLDILGRDAKISKKEALLLAKTVKNEGKEMARQRLEQLCHPRDLVQQLKDKQRVVNPHYVGEVCQLVAKGDVELKPVSGCWCIVVEVKTYSCRVRTWRKDFEAVKPEHLKRLNATNLSD